MVCTFFPIIAVVMRLRFRGGTHFETCFFLHIPNCCRSCTFGWCRSGSRGNLDVFLSNSQHPSAVFRETGVVCGVCSLPFSTPLLIIVMQLKTISHQHKSLATWRLPWTSRSTTLCHSFENSIPCLTQVKQFRGHRHTAPRKAFLTFVLPYPGSSTFTTWASPATW